MMARNHRNNKNLALVRRTVQEMGGTIKGWRPGRRHILIDAQRQDGTAVSLTAPHHPVDDAMLARWTRRKLK